MHVKNMPKQRTISALSRKDFHYFKTKMVSIAITILKIRKHFGKLMFAKFRSVKKPKWQKENATRRQVTVQFMREKCIVSVVNN